MDAREVSRQLLAALGGRENVTSNIACVTRLRIGIRDFGLVDLDAVKAVDGVKGVVEADTLQVVFGPGTAGLVLDAFAALTGIPKGETRVGGADDRGEEEDGSVPDAAAAARRNQRERASRQTNPVQAFLRHLANIFVPLLPGIIAAGLINGVTNIINITSGGALDGAWWYQTIRTVGWALFAYLPIFAGYNAAREFGGSPILGGIAGALCVANSAMPLLAGTGDAQVLLPMTQAAYNPANGGLIAALLAGGLFALIERGVRKVMPVVVDTFLTPLIVVIVGGLALVTVLQPLGALLTQGIYTVMSFVYGELGIAGGYLLAAGFLPLVSVGMHQALTPIHAMLNDPNGPTAGINYLLPILMMSGGGQVGAGLALYLKTKNQKLKGYIRDSLPVGVLGVGEPLMYAVTLPLGRSFVTACLGAGFGGAVAEALHIGADSQGVSGLFGLLIVEPGQQLSYVIAMVCAIAGGFVLTWFFGVDEQRIGETYGK